ncbi:uncharacterized protein LOC115567705 [Sparus aurata]|uniref:uncharacterized protein LOC115567705 n=1 Tax=Sparus aurata TaxID=8175 RepID=UPI0011C19A5D|nr:uncharacterized protein LOC115567705 [Sparus aurata]
MRICHFFTSLVRNSLTATMYNPKAKHSCSVIRCTDTRVSLHHLPTKEDIRTKWLNFIFQGNISASESKSVFVCANHFTPDCFSNQGQYKAGLAMRLFLTDGSTPTVCGNATDEGTPGTYVQQPVVHHVACQTDQPVTCTVGTQLSMRTLQPHFRSTDYIDALLDLIFEKDPAPYVNEVLNLTIPEDLLALYERPDNLEIIASYVSRFNQGQV